MSLPDRIAPEYLALFGFEIDSNDVSEAKHPRFRSYRHFCPVCRQWVKQASRTGSDPYQCKYCIYGKKAPRPKEPASKIYCCSNRRCHRVKAFLTQLRDGGAQVDPDYHDGMGGPCLRIKRFPPQNSAQKRRLLELIFTETTQHSGYRRLVGC